MVNIYLNLVLSLRYARAEDGYRFIQQYRCHSYSMKATITVALAEEATSSATCMMLFCMLIKADRLRKIIYMRGVRLRKIITNSI